MYLSVFIYTYILYTSLIMYYILCIIIYNTYHLHYICIYITQGEDIIIY